jgi:hypothetical protein
MTTDALPMPRKSPVVSVLVSLAAVAVIAVAVLYLSDRRGAQASVQQAAAETSALMRQADQDVRWLETAIREKRAILGMTRYEVEMAKGKPDIRYRGQNQPDAMLNAGGVETWIYETHDGKGNSVVFGLNGQVIFAMDALGKPRQGHAIRQ